MELDRMAQLIATAVMTLATVLILGPGAPSILAQQAIRQVAVRLRRSR